MQFRRLEPQDFSKAADFYAQAGYSSPLEPHEVVLTAQENGEIIGLVRLVEEHGVQVLRGMQIRPDHQRRNLGTDMLNKLK